MPVKPIIKTIKWTADIYTYLINDTLNKLLILHKNTTRMKIIISPAKKLNTAKVNNSNSSEIRFHDEAKYLVDQLKGYSVNDIKELMGLSDTLAELNYKRFQSWSLDSKDVMPAVYMFQGDVYKSMRVAEFSEDDMKFAQENLMIISGLYGLLKPLDLIFPYRLEMGTKMQNNNGNNLYEFWGDKLNKSMLSKMEDNEILS